MWECTCSKAEEVYNEASTLPADEWANIVLQELQESGGDLLKVTQLGSHYLSHLVIAFRNPGGKLTPQDNFYPRPSHRSIEQIEELLADAKTSHWIGFEGSGHTPRRRPLSTHGISFLPSRCCDTPLCSYHPVFYQLKDTNTCCN